LKADHLQIGDTDMLFATVTLTLTQLSWRTKLS